MANGFMNLERQNVRDAALRRVRAQAAPRAAQLAQNIRVSGGGIRTSGISLLPQAQAARERALAEAGVEEGLAKQELGQLGQESLLDRQAALREAAARSAFGRKRDADKGAGRRAIQQALIAGAIGFAGRGLQGGLAGR